MADYLVDTDILIDISKGNKAAMLFLSNLENVNISIITSMELIVGAKNNAEINEIEKFLQRFNIISVDNEICSFAYGLLKRHALSYGLTIPDSLIAATAIINNFNLATKNVKHFRLIKNLNLKIPEY